MCIDNALTPGAGNRRVDQAGRKEPRRALNGLYALLLLMPSAALAQDPTNWNVEADRFSYNQTIWEGYGFQSYSFVMDKRCYGCARFFPARVVIEDGRLMAVLDPETDEPLESTFPEDEVELLLRQIKAGYFESIEGVFSVVERAIQNNITTTHPGDKVSTLFVEYDASYGFPARLHVESYGGIDSYGREYFATHGSFGISVSEFEYTF